MNHPRTLLTAATLTLLTGTLAQAADSKYGFQLTVSKPQGDLKKSIDDKLGLGLGLHALVDLGSGHALVPRLDYVQYKKDYTYTSLGAPNLEIQVKHTILTLGADYEYFFGAKANQGFYVLAGLGYAKLKFDFTYSDDPNESGSETEASYYLQGGCGYQFTSNMGAELRYQHLKFTDVDPDYPGFDFSTPSIQASFVVRF